MDRRSTDPEQPSARSFLPLKPAVVLILTSLAERPGHGYAIMTRVRERSGGDIELGTSHLYRLLKKLLDDGLIVESGREPDDPRRRGYRLSDLGREVLEAEMRRLRSLLRLGRDLGLVTSEKT